MMMQCLCVRESPEQRGGGRLSLPEQEAVETMSHDSSDEDIVLVPSLPDHSVSF